jgi:hypothetical protein
MANCNESVAVPCNQSVLVDQKSFFDFYFSNFIGYICVGGVICLFGIISNSLCFLAICINPKLRKSGNILVANLLFLNILLGITVHPVTLISILYRQYGDLAKDFCDWLVYYYLVMHSFVWQECLLAVNRFVAILVPHQYRLISTKRGIAATLCCGYSIALIINVFPLGQKVKVYASSLPFGACLYNVKRGDLFPIFHAVFGVYLPMCIIGACYVTVFTTLWLKKLRIRKLGQGVVGPTHNHQLQNKRTKLARMLFGSFIWYALTYLPHPLLTAFFKNIYTLHPTLFFYVRWVLQLGVGGNAVSIKCSFILRILMKFPNDSTNT